jgi:hypothetical protein
MSVDVAGGSSSSVMIPDVKQQSAINTIRKSYTEVKNGSKNSGIYIRKKS